MSEDTSPDPHPDSPSGQPYSAPRQAWGGNADPRNLNYEGLRYFGPGYEQPNDVPWDGAPPQSYLPSPTLGYDELNATSWSVPPIPDDVELVGQLGRLYDWTAEERDHVAALVAEARDTFASARSEQDRLAGWVLANCPGEPSQDGGVVDTVIRLIGTARADGIEEGRGDMEHLERKWRAEERERIAARIEYTLDTDLDSFAAGSPAHERAKAVVGTMRIAARIARDSS